MCVSYDLKVAVPGSCLRDLMLMISKACEEIGGLDHEDWRQLQGSGEPADV